jgi:hypothetical protein
MKVMCLFMLSGPGHQITERLQVANEQDGAWVWSVSANVNFFINSVGCFRTCP